MKSIQKYGVMITSGAALGLIASFLQMLEKITLLKHVDQPLVCDLSSKFSCSNVLNAWQSSVFGFPNSLMCMVFFTFFMTIGLVMWSKGEVARALRLTTQFLALFMLGFGTWFLYQSSFVIQSVCIFCLFCYGGLLLVNAGLLRLNASDMPFGKKTTAKIKRFVSENNDVVLWIIFTVVIYGTIIMKIFK